MKMREGKQAIIEVFRSPAMFFGINHLKRVKNGQIILRVQCSNNDNDNQNNYSVVILLSSPCNVTIIKY